MLDHSQLFERPCCLFVQEEDVCVIHGDIQYVDQLLDISQLRTTTDYTSISLVPYAQLRENGFDAHHDDEPILSLIPDTQRRIDRAAFFGSIPDHTLAHSDIQFEMTDDEFCAAVAAIVKDEIFNGEGCNFLMSRQAYMQLPDVSGAHVLTIFKYLVENDCGAYCCFCFFDGTRFFVGASPERHITYRNGAVKMNPICGTLPKSKLKTTADLMAFVQDKKEIYELFQVVDETLKMMAKICTMGGQIVGPFLKEMSTLIHTEYYLEGQSDRPPLELLKATLFAPTMVGSPLQNAARIIKKYEQSSRGYYSSCLVFLGYDESDQLFLDSAITIRTVQIEPSGRCRFQSGASVVRDSVPQNELLEIQAKVQSLVQSVSGERARMMALESVLTPDIQTVLMQRNQFLSNFWFESQDAAHHDRLGLRVLVIDNDDQFSFMLAHMIRTIGYEVDVVSSRDSFSWASYDAVVLGPGPGNPMDDGDPRMVKVRDICARLIDEKKPYLGVCLGHQVTCLNQGLSLVRLTQPIQGVQKEVVLYGQSQKVGYYNSFAAVVPDDFDRSNVTVVNDSAGDVVMCEGPSFVTIQFHVESVLTQYGKQLLTTLMRDVLAKR